MCFPLYCLRSLLKFGTGLTIAAALVSLGFGFYLMYESNQLNKSALFFDKTKLLKNIVEYALIIAGALLALIGIFGSCGATKKSQCCLCIFQFGAMIFTIIFIGFGLVSQIMPTKVFTNDCQSMEWSNGIQNVSTLASDIFCKTQCQCDINAQKFNDPKVLIGLYFANDTSLPSYVQNCSDYDTQLDVPATFMETAEEYFNCAGWCTESSIYMFSNVNRGNPSAGESCFVSTKNFFQKNGQLLSYIFYAIGGFIGLLVIVAFCLCFHPSLKRQGKSSYYERMGYYED